MKKHFYYLLTLCLSVPTFLDAETGDTIISRQLAETVEKAPQQGNRFFLFLGSFILTLTIIRIIINKKKAKKN